jgi:hypothetical protein
MTNYEENKAIPEVEIYGHADGAAPIVQGEVHTGVPNPNVAPAGYSLKIAEDIASLQAPEEIGVSDGLEVLNS